MVMANFFEVWKWTLPFGLLAALRQFVPREYTDSYTRNIKIWLQRFTPYIFFDICEFESSVPNTLYDAVEIYLSSLQVDGAQHVNLWKSKNNKSMKFALANQQSTFDTFDRAQVEWVYTCYDRKRPMYSQNFESSSDEKRLFTLQVKKKDRERMLDRYIRHIESRAVELKRAARELLLYTNSKGRDNYWRQRKWESVVFSHPATFETLALDEDLKKKVMTDLEHFAGNEEYYRRVGKAWKRGYLLFGPPGTGKSSMIAAIANRMRYDVYDLELTEVESNSELRKLLLNTSNKSIVVIEDIDCSLDLSGQRKKKKAVKKTETTPGQPDPPKRDDEQRKVTLSGLLNFVDGLWSCCGSERIFIFTTNYKKKLDPALLRAGRMDMHICLSYCTFSAFKVLAKNYLQITEHELFEKVESAFQGSFMTPAEVTELLIRNQDDGAEVALENLIAALGEHREDPSLKPNSDQDSDEEAEEEDPKKEAKKDSSEDPIAATTSGENIRETEQEKQQLAKAKESSTVTSEMDILKDEDVKEIDAKGRHGKDEGAKGNPETEAKPETETKPETQQPAKESSSATPTGASDPQKEDEEGVKEREEYAGSKLEKPLEKGTIATSGNAVVKAAEEAKKSTYDDVLQKQHSK